MTSQHRDEQSTRPEGGDPFDLRDTTKERRARIDSLGLPVGDAPTPKVQLSKAKKFRRGLMLGIGATILTVLLLWSGVSVLQHWRLSRTVSMAEQSRLLDTYQGHADALERLMPALENTRVLPGLLDLAVFEGLGPFPGTSVGDLRKRIRSEQAELAALIEWRYEWADSRQAVALIDELDPAQPAAMAGRLYLMLLSEDEPSATASVTESWAIHGDKREVQEAVAEAIFAFDLDGPREDVINALSAEEKMKSPRRLFLAAALTDQRASDGGARSLAAFTAEHPDHIDGLIAFGMAMTRGDERVHEERLATLVAVEPPQIGPYQKARGLQFLGGQRRERGDIREAIVHLRAAIDASPARVSLYPALVDVQIEQGLYEEALGTLDAMNAQAGGVPRPDMLSRRARVLLLTGRGTEALEVIRPVTIHTPESGFVAGLVYLEVGNPSAAKQAFEAASKGRYGTSDAKAFTLYSQKLTESDANSEAILEALAEIAEAEDASADVGRAYGLAMMHEADSRANRNRRRQGLQRAGKQLRASLEKNPRHVLLANDICRLELMFPHRERADEACRAALELSSAYTPGLANLIRLRLKEEQFESALQQVFRARENLRGDRSFEIDALEVEALIGLRRFEDAASKVNGWTGLTGREEVERGLLRGKLAIAQHRHLDALDPLERAHRADPDHEEVALRLAHAWVKTGYWEEADPILRELLSSPYWGAEAWYALGELRRRQGRFPDARTNLRRATERLSEHMAPGRLHVLINTETALAWQDRFHWNHAQVQRHLGFARRRAEEYSIDVPEYLVIEGVFHLAKRRPEPELARELVEKAVEVDPLYCDGWTALTAVYRLLRERRNPDLPKQEVECP